MASIVDVRSRITQLQQKRSLSSSESQELRNLNNIVFKYKRDPEFKRYFTGRATEDYVAKQLGKEYDVAQAKTAAESLNKEDLTSGELIRAGRDIAKVGGSVELTRPEEQVLGFSRAEPYGMSIAPDLNPVSIRNDNRPFGIATVTYESGRKETVQTGTTNIFGKDVSISDSRFNKPQSFGSKVLNLIPKGIETSGEFAGIGARYYAAKVAPILTSKPVNKLRNVFGQDSVSATDINLNIVQSRAKLGTELGLTYGSSRAGGQLIGKGLGFLPTNTLKFLSSKPVGYTLTGAYVAGAGYSVAKSTDPIRTAAFESVSFAGFSTGIKEGIKVSGGLNKILKNKPKVTTVEGFKSTSKSIDFKQNVGFSEGGKINILSGTTSSQGTGLYQSGKKFYKVSFGEKGNQFNVGEDLIATKSAAQLKIQQYKYFLRKPLGVGRPASAQMSTRGLIKSSDGGFELQAASKIRSRGVSFERLTKLKGVTNDLKTNFYGESVDVRKGGVIAKNVLKGQTDINLQYDSKALTGEPFTFTQSTTKQVGISKDAIKLGFSKGLSSNVKAFRKTQFVDSGNAVLGVQSKISTPQVSTLSNANIKSLLVNKIVQSNVRSYKTLTRNVGKNINVGTVTTNKILPSSTTKSFTLPKSIPITKQSSSIKQSYNIKSAKAQLPKQDSQTRTDLSLKNLQRQPSAQKNLLGVDVGLRQIRDLSQKQKQVVQQRQISTPKVVPRFNLGIRNINIKLPSKSVQFNLKSSFGTIRRSKISYSYSPSVEANLFKIRGRSISKNLAKTGLVLRPIRVSV